MSPYLDPTVESDCCEPENDVENVLTHIDDDPETLRSSLDPFTITTSTGFMPFRPPLISLPSCFDSLNALVDELPVVKLDGTPGLLATYSLGPKINGGHALPDLTDDIDSLIAADGHPDLFAVTAVFRDYAFLASAYLLEPCWERCNKGVEGYGLGRQMLPRVIAGPLVKTAKILNIHPFMSYAAAYTLFNYRFADEAVGDSEYKNLRLIRAFERGLDPYSSEAGFVLTHVDMVKHSGGLIKGTTEILNAISSGADRTNVVGGLVRILDTMRLVEDSMETMCQFPACNALGDLDVTVPLSSGKPICDVLTFGSMFPNGVVYEGENNNEPMFFRGESGANDSMIPLLDGLLQIPMPVNPLTEILKDFRSYRPKPHRDFLTYVRQRAEELDVRGYCCSDPETTILYLRLLDHVRSFRWRHWLFAREYIIRRSTHPTATGGSPIVTWLPNQLFAVMELMNTVWHGIDPADQRSQPQYIIDMMEEVEDSQRKLKREVQRWCQERAIPS